MVSSDVTLKISSKKHVQWNSYHGRGLGRNPNSTASPYPHRPYPRARRIVIDKIKYQERTEMYHREAGGAKLREIMYRLQQRLMGRVIAKLRVKVGWLIFEERDKAALRIQTMLRRVRGLQVRSGLGLG